MRIALAFACLLSQVLIAADGRWSARFPIHLPAPPDEVLLGLLEHVDKTKTFEERREAIPAAMKALLAADRDLLLQTMALALRKGGGYDDSHRMLFEHGATRFPEESVALVARTGSSDTREEAAWQVWSVIARTDPERALNTALAYFAPEGDYFRSQLQTSGPMRPVCFIAEAVGGRWLARDGIAAISKLGTLPHAKEIDHYLYEGMCEAASTPDECRALLTWWEGPGRYVDRMTKGFDPWWQRPLRKLAEQDLAKARAWVEAKFPAKTRRRESGEDAWDGNDFRRILAYVWAKTDARAAADWHIAQYDADDPDTSEALRVSVDLLSSAKGAGIEDALHWFEGFEKNPHFISVLASLLNEAGSDADVTSLQSISTWMAGLAPELVERVLITARKHYSSYSVPFPLTEENEVLRHCCPDAGQRRALLGRLKSELKDQVGARHAAAMPSGDYGLDEFRLAHNKLTLSSVPEALAQAKQLAKDYRAATMSHDPQERLSGMSAFDWLASAPEPELKKVLLAHIENRGGGTDEYNSVDLFVSVILECWTRLSWSACEQFAWDAPLPAQARRVLLIETFKHAADRHPDEVFTRLSELAAKGRFRVSALRVDGSDIQCGGSCYMGTVAQRAGAGWIKQDGAAAIPKLRALPPEWQLGAVQGAVEAFNSTEAAQALLTWFEEAAATKQKGADPQSWVGRSHRGEAKDVLERLARMDLSAARQWLEAKPERLKKTEDSYDAVYRVSGIMFERDPLEAAAWLQRVRPSEDTTWMLLQALVAKDEKLALDWLAAHADDLHIDSAYAVMADRWEIKRPAEAALMVAKMTPGKRTRRAASLYHTWSRLDEKAARQFLDTVIRKGTTERAEIDQEIKRLDGYAYDRR